MEREKIIEIVETILQDDEDLFLVDVVVKGHVGNQKILVFIDGDNGISIDTCSAVSRRLGAELEELDLMTSKYTLEVSSPGLDFPLVMKRQYLKNIGRSLEIEKTDGEKIEGKLIDVGEESFLLGMNSKEETYSYEEIKQSKVKISFK